MNGSHNHKLIWSAVVTLCGMFTFSLAIRATYPNLALHQPAKQSSTLVVKEMGGMPEKAVDGNTDGDLEKGFSCSHTIAADTPWWMVDLGKTYMVSTLLLTNRDDCCWDRLRDVEITIGDIEDSTSSLNEICATDLDLEEPKTHLVDCLKPTLGRYVYIHLLGKKMLTLCEVQVFSEYAPSLFPATFLVPHNDKYVEATLADEVDAITNKLSIKMDSGEVVVKEPKDLYANFPMHWKSVVVGDNVLAAFYEDLYTMKPLYEAGVVIDRDGLFRFKVQSRSNANFVKYVQFSELRHRDVCKLNTACPANSQCNSEFLSEKFLPTSYMCKCKKGFHSSARRVASYVLPANNERCLGGSLTVNKPTNQSDTLDDAVSSRAVDGNTDYRFGVGSSCSSTTQHPNAWWRVDLEKIEPVSEVFIQFAWECCKKEATKLLITVGPYKKDSKSPEFGDSNANSICSRFSIDQIPPDKGWNVHCGRMILGRYVYIRSLENKRLTFCEVHVYREPTDNIALYMSNDIAAVDGDVLTCFHSALVFEPRWTLDLQYVRPVALVQICTGILYDSKAEVYVGRKKTDKSQACISSNAVLKKDTFVEFSCNRPSRWKGRYVFITIPDTKTHLSLCEVNVYAVFEMNLSQGKEATQSSFAMENLNPHDVLDGDKETCIFTTVQKDPWVKVSLGSKHDVSGLLISTLVTHLSITVFVDGQPCGGTSHAYAGQPLPVLCSPKLSGKDIIITIKGQNKFLSLCEVEVYAEIRDDDECQAWNPCPKGTTCKNFFGTYKCGCNPGTEAAPGTEYHFSPVCQDVDECAVENPCGANSSCHNSFGSYACSCHEGYKWNVSKCIDVDECETADRCDSHAKCVNTIGSYMCICLPGYSGDSKNLSCHDVDECVTDANSCDRNAVCINTFSSFSCRCQEGWFGDGKTCFDVNECQFDHACPDHSDCRNHPGTFECLCHRGFRKSNKGLCIFEVPDSSKLDSDQCSYDKKECIPHIKCIVVKVFYRCTCKDDTTTNKQKCVDTVDCSRGLVPFNDRAKCINVLDSYDCECGHGYTGHRRSCADLEGCEGKDRDSLRCRPFASCIKIPDSSLCYCNEGYLRKGSLCDVC